MRTLSCIYVQILAVSAALIVPHLQANAIETAPYPDSRLAAEKSIETLRQLIKNGNPKIFGFESATEAATLLQDASSVLGSPLRIYWLRPASMKDPAIKADPEQSLVESYRVIYPVITG